LEILYFNNSNTRVGIYALLLLCRGERERERERETRELKWREREGERERRERGDRERKREGERMEVAQYFGYVVLENLLIYLLNVFL
jgi:hypothetical protein